MTRKKKLILKFLKNPQSLRYAEIETILLYLGFSKTSVKGSHQKFSHPILFNHIIIPVHDNDCKKGYKKKIAKLIKELYF